MIGEFQPKFDYRPKWKLTDPADPTSAWIPDIDAATGLQVIKRVAYQTFHQLFWPGDSTVSSITANAWFTISKGWDNPTNPVSGTVFFIGTNADLSPKYLGAGGSAGQAFTLSQDREFTTDLPAGTKKISVRLDPHDHAVGWAIEAQAA
jgi:hypothetical protein